MEIGMGKDTDRGVNRTLNELLIRLFARVMDTEEKAIITADYKDLSNNDMHIIEAIGIAEPRRMKDIARSLGVTTGTLTTNMNSLERKGYITRTRSLEDKRVVYVTLTEKGKKAFYHHRDFHKKMIRAAVRDLDGEEVRILIRCLKKLDVFFQGWE